SGSPLDGAVLAVSAPRVAGQLTRVFELTDGAGGRLGRLVETARGANDSSIGAVMSTAAPLVGATTREVRGAQGWPVVVVAWSQRVAGTVTVTLPDRREIGRLVAVATATTAQAAPADWSIVGFDGRTWGSANRAGASAWDGG